ncbi:DNA replication factor Cdt1 [Stomoxys calcitrans]|uniref:DNA replication factor Cdt1 n=1 Tax=Stomoxys calcitrans TaxID=35570 RepID=UPI0027E347FE|nr:DNA replication factor Cdt1 [Stomoxys calcitrans]
MAQPSIAAFFNTRKRAVAEDVTTIKNRRLLDNAEPTRQESNANIPSQNNPTNDAPQPQQEQNDDIAALKKMGMRTRTVVKRIGVQDPSQVPDSGVSPKKMSKIEENVKQQKLVEFIKKGTLSPRKKPAATKTKSRQKVNESTPTATIITAFTSQNNNKNMERGLKTPTKQIIKGSNTPLKQGELKSLVKKELTFDEVKTKVSRSAKLQELKASLARIQELEKTRKAQEERNRMLKESMQSPSKKTPVLQLKEFDKIELEVLTSPSKTFKTPTKLPPPTPDKNELMSPRHTDVSKRVLFSPAKLGSPSKLVVPPAYQRFMSLAETSKAGQLPLPYKYRHLIEIFKGLDSVCAMFHNRREVITFKKLKPAVQRMLRKNFYERHLAQIKCIFPEAFIFTQMKMRNYGSASKADYFQLVIAPNVENLPEKMKMNKIDEDDVLTSAQSNSMNPHVMTERLQRFQFLLLQKVKEEHEKFLKSLDPPLSIPKEKVTRWHPDFDLENCPEIPLANLPQPPNVEKYSSAKDILSTARNLFNCATPMERVMERYEAKIEAEKVKAENQKNLDNAKAETSKESQASMRAKEDSADKPAEQKDNATPVDAASTTATNPTAADATSNLLKGVPKSLLEKIRAKQAAKALDAMTRRPSQDQEAAKYSRLPEMARHLRNVFITERKGVLTQEIVIKKIQNSFRTSLTAQDIENHLKLMAKEVPAWVAFHEVRKTMYLKINKEMDLSKVIERLETVANEKSKM